MICAVVLGVMGWDRLGLGMVGVMGRDTLGLEGFVHWCLMEGRGFSCRGPGHGRTGARVREVVEQVLEIDSARLRPRILL